MNAPKPNLSAALKRTGAGAALALAALVGMEGVEFTPYRDSVGVLTGCVGSTGAHVIEGQTLTPETCAEWLGRDYMTAQATVDRCVPGANEHQRAALTLFAFNVGPGKAGVKDGLCVLKTGGMPTIRRQANAGNWVAACAELGPVRWVRAGGKVLRGLVKRRAAERALCEGRLDAPELLHYVREGRKWFG